MRRRLARRGLAYLLLAVAASGIVFLRQQARRADAGRDSRTVSGATLGADALLPLEGGQRYLIEASGDRQRLGALALNAVIVVDQATRMRERFTPSFIDARRNAGRGRIRQLLGSFVSPRDGEYLVRLETTPAATRHSADSFYVVRAASGRDLSRSFGMMALGVLLFLVILALGGIVGRSFLDGDAT
ncbi:MAG: hypothetical protein IT359_11640 [Gemmatimonadaceae bacterium]|nr:hypothetical protein [Gemmatimonadaceae bacterium]